MRWYEYLLLTTKFIVVQAGCTEHIVSITNTLLIFSPTEPLWSTTTYIYRVLRRAARK